MVDRITYDNFDLLFTHGVGSYQVRVTGAPSGEVPEQLFDIPFSEQELENFVLRLRGSKGRVRRFESPEVEQAKRRGGELFASLFRDRLETGLRRSLDKSRSAGRGLRIRLNLTETPVLLNLPWEFLFDESTNRFLTLFDDTPVVRYLAVEHAAEPLSTTLPLRILVMVSDPDDDEYEDLDVDKERADLETAVKVLRDNGRLAMDFIPAKLRDLQTALRSRDYHVFHFIGHGGFVEVRQDGALVLQDDRGRALVTSGQVIGTFLAGHRPLRLAVLNSCEGGRSGTEDAFAGVAQTLVQQGVPAVVAMQFEITDAAAISFSEDFYSSLVLGYPVDAALSEARKAIYAQPNHTEWATPVLYMRSPNGILFDLVPTEPGVPAPEITVSDPVHGPAVENVQILNKVKPTNAPERIELREIARVAHGDEVNAVSFSPDGSLLATASDDNTVRISDSRTGRKIARVTHEDEVNAVSFSPDGSLLATASDDKTVRISDPRNGRKFARVHHEDKVNAVSFSPDGSLLATASDDNTVRISDPRTGRKIARVTHEDEVNAVSFSPDGSLLATASDDKTVRVSDPRTGQEIVHVTQDYNVEVASFSPDGSLLATASWSYIRQVQPRRVFRPTVTKVIKVGYDYSSVYDPRTGREIAQITHEDCVNAVSFSPDGSLLATASDDKTVRISDPRTGREIARVHHEDKVNAVSFSPDGSLLATASYDDTVRISDPRTGQEIVHVTQDCVNAVSFSPDGSLLAMASWDDEARVFELFSDLP